MTIYDQIGHPAYFTRETQRNSYDMAQHVVKNNIPGIIVECGIAAGAQLATMILGCLEAGENRTAWGFDSFEGIQLAGPKDTVQPGLPEIKHDVNVPDKDLLKSSGVTSVPLAVVIELLKRWDVRQFVKLVPGWIQESLTETVVKEINSISVLRLDMDIYDPTKFALEQLYPLVSPGGVIIIDDWVLDGCRAACKEYFAEHGITPNLKTIPNSGPVYFFKPAERS